MFTVKVGVVPGAIKEVVVEGVTSVAKIIELAELSAEGYSIRLNGNNVDMSAEVTGDSTVLLSKMIKGNSAYTIKVGVVPGAINEFVFSDPTQLSEVLTHAGLNQSGYSIRVNGNVIDDMAHMVTSDSTILLAKQIKGNSAYTIKVGVVPGAIKEVVVEGTITVNDVLQLAELNAEGYSIRLNGNNVDVASEITSSSTVLLSKMIKGNK